MNFSIAHSPLLTIRVHSPLFGYLRQSLFEISLDKLNAFEVTLVPANGTVQKSISAVQKKIFFLNFAWDECRHVNIPR